MEIYLLKSVGCLLLLIAFYKLFLEQSSMHNLKRAYLLIAAIAPLTIPFITFTNYVEVDSLSAITSAPISVESAAAAETTVSLEEVLWVVYFTGLTFFGLRFTWRLGKLFRRIQKNPKQRYNNIFKVFLQQEINPHTFLSYIFLNNRAHEQNEIPHIVIEHEMVHARERHSLDILILELIKVIFWFNPLFILLGKSMKLNHEFLADKGVLDRGVPASTYQKTILAYSSHAGTPQMAHSINYSSLKKRFTVMKTKSSRKSVWLRSSLLLPLIAIMLFSFSSQKEVYVERPDLNKSRKIIEPKHPDRGDFARWSDHGKYVLTLDGKEITSSELKEYHPDDLPFYSETLTSEGKILVSIMTNPFWQNESGIGFGDRDLIVLSDFVNDIKSFTLIVDSEQITLNGKSTNLSSFADDLDEITRNWEEPHYTSAEPKIYLTNVSGLFLEKLNREFVKTHYSKANEGVVLKDITTTEIVTQTSATRQEMKEYNKLARKYNAMERDKRIVKLKDLKRMELIYRKMSDKQRADAEPFPECIPPPPPPPPPPGEAPKLAANKVASKVVGSMPPPPPPPPPGQAPKAASKVVGSMPAPPPPPPKAEPPSIKNLDVSIKPGDKIYLDGREISVDRAKKTLKDPTKLKRIQWIKNSDGTKTLNLEKYDLVVTDRSYGSALDLIVTMAKRDAKFYYNEKKISSDEAIELIKGNPDLEVRSQTDYQNGNKSKVWISDKQ